LKRVQALEEAEGARQAEAARRAAAEAARRQRQQQEAVAAEAARSQQEAAAQAAKAERAAWREQQEAAEAARIQQQQQQVAAELQEQQAAAKAEAAQIHLQLQQQQEEAMRQAYQEAVAAARRAVAEAEEAEELAHLEELDRRKAAEEKASAAFAKVVAAAAAELEQQRLQQVRQYGRDVLAKAEAYSRGRDDGAASLEWPAFEFDNLVVLPAVTEDSVDSIASSAKSPSGKKKAGKKTPNRRSKPSKAPKTFEIFSTPQRAGHRSPTIAENLAASGAKTGSSHRKRQLLEIETEAEAKTELDVRRFLASDSLQSPSKKLKERDEGTVQLPPLISRVPWYPQMEEREVVQDFGLIGEGPTASSTTESSPIDAADREL
jgi:hypothetical protein